MRRGSKAITDDDDSSILDTPSKPKNIIDFKKSVKKQLDEILNQPVTYQEFMSNLGEIQKKRVLRIRNLQNEQLRKKVVV